MSFRATVLWRHRLGVLLLALITAPVAFGQLATSPIAFANEDAVTTSFVPAPNVSGGGGGGGGNTQWLKIEFHYGTTVNLKDKFLPSAQFKVIVEGLNPDATNSTGGKGVAVGFTGDVTYINIAAGKDIYGSFYVHPSTLSRYCASTYEDYDRKFNVHVEAYIDGVLVDRVDKKKEKDPDGWFKGFTMMPGLVFRQNQCPFMVSDSDRYPAIQMSATGQ